MVPSLHVGKLRHRGWVSSETASQSLSQSLYPVLSRKTLTSWRSRGGHRLADARKVSPGKQSPKGDWSMLGKGMQERRRGGGQGEEAASSRTAQRGSPQRGGGQAGRQAGRFQEEPRVRLGLPCIPRAWHRVDTPQRAGHWRVQMTRTAVQLMPAQVLTSFPRPS